MSILFLFYFRIFIIFWLLGLCFCTWAFSSCSKHRLLPCLWCMGSSCGSFSGTENGLWRGWASVVAALGLGGVFTVAHGFVAPACGVFLVQGISLSPALVGGLLTTGPVGSLMCCFYVWSIRRIKCPNLNVQLYKCETMYLCPLPPKNIW